jgi:hypothetical protein
MTHPDTTARQAIVAAYTNREASLRALAKRFSTSLGSVQRIIRSQAQTHHLWPSPYKLSLILEVSAASSAQSPTDPRKAIRDYRAPEPQQP